MAGGIEVQPDPADITREQEVALAERKAEARHPFDVIAAGLEREGGTVVVTRHQGEWTVGLHFGREDEDSDMAGGASYGIDTDLMAALRFVVDETGWGRA